jgi:hypothetical protein
VRLINKQYAEAGGPIELFQRLAAVVGSTRRWAHFTELLVIDCASLGCSLTHSTGRISFMLVCFGAG